MTLKVKGPELSQKKIALINSIKDIEKDLLNLVSTIKNSEDLSHDPRWLSIGVTDLEKGFMGLVKGICMNSHEINE